MSFPSVSKHIEAYGKSLEKLTAKERLSALAQAWMEDCPRAYRRLKRAYESKHDIRSYNIQRNQKLHMEMLRTFAATAIREGVLPHLFPKKRFDFINCCADMTSDDKKPVSLETIITLQIQFQNGEKAYADC